MSKTLYLIRHGEPLLVKTQKTSLNEKGILQTDRLSEKLVADLGYGSSIKLLYSPSMRCEETATIISAKLGITMQMAPLRFENADAISSSDIQSMYSYYMKHFQTQGVEAPRQYVKRISKIVTSCKKEVVILVGNEVNIRVLLQILGGKRYNTPIEHAQCYKLKLQNNNDHVVIERIV